MKAQSAGICAICGKQYEKGAQIRDGQDGKAGVKVHVICRRRVAQRRRLLGDK